eukprot:37870_1
MASEKDDTEYYINTLSDLESTADELNDLLGNVVGYIAIEGIDELRNRENVTTTELLDYIYNYIQRYETMVEIYESKIAKLKQSNRENATERRDEVIDVLNRMLKKSIEREYEQDKELKLLQDRLCVLECENENLKLKTAIIECIQQDNDTDDYKSVQLQKYINDNFRLKKELKEMKTKLKCTENKSHIERMKQEYGIQSESMSEVPIEIFIGKKLLDAEQDFKDRIDRLTEELAEKNRDLEFERCKNEQNDKLRRDSLQTVHNKMLTKLLDAEADHDEKEEKLESQIKEIQCELRKQILQNDALQLRKDVIEVLSVIVSDYLFGSQSFDIQ